MKTFEFVASTPNGNVFSGNVLEISVYIKSDANTSEVAKEIKQVKHVERVKIIPKEKSSASSAIMEETESRVPSPSGNTKKEQSKPTPAPVNTSSLFVLICFNTERFNTLSENFPGLI